MNRTTVAAGTLHVLRGLLPAVVVLCSGLPIDPPKMRVIVLISVLLIVRMATPNSDPTAIRKRMHGRALFYCALAGHGVVAVLAAFFRFPLTAVVILLSGLLVLTRVIAPARIVHLPLVDLLTRAVQDGLLLPIAVSLTFDSANLIGLSVLAVLFLDSVSIGLVLAIPGEAAGRREDSIWSADRRLASFLALCTALMALLVYLSPWSKRSFESALTTSAVPVLLLFFAFFSLADPAVTMANSRIRTLLLPAVFIHLAGMALIGLI
jgi:hypothetical protein